MLWSHYAARHRGICLGFNVPKTELLEVKYANNRLLAQVEKVGEREDIDDPLRELLITTKFRDWEYEQEFRMRVPLSASLKEGHNYFFPFDENLQLVEVILGPLCELSLAGTRKIVSQNFPSSVTFQARLAIKSFAIVPKESTLP